MTNSDQSLYALLDKHRLLEQRLKEAEKYTRRWLKISLQGHRLEEQIRQMLGDSEVIRSANFLHINRLRMIRNSQSEFEDIMKNIVCLIQENFDHISRSPKETEDIEDTYAEPISGYEDPEWVFDEIISTQTSPSEMLDRQKEIGTLILGRNFPDEIQIIFKEVRSLYIFGFSMAALAMSRVLLEAAIRHNVRAKSTDQDIGRMIGRIRDQGVRSLVVRDLWCELSSAVLHSPRRTISPEKIHDVVNCVEDLFSLH